MSGKEINRIWEGKWNNILRYYTLDMEMDEWERIWESIHDSIIPYEIQSSIWEMLHLNFYCGYKERILNYGTGNCKLCGDLEQGSQHIVVDCSVLVSCLETFRNILGRLRNDIVSKDEMAFGLAGANVQELDKKDKLRNFITFIIRTVVFKNRHISYGNMHNTIQVLKAKINYKINDILKSMHIIYKYRFSVNDFVDTFLIENILGRIENGALYINL